MEENHDEVEDVAGASSDSFIDDSEDDGPSTSGQDDGSFIEAGHFTCFLFASLICFLPNLQTIKHIYSCILLLFILGSDPLS